MVDYYIIGSGGFAKEVYFLVESTLEDYSFKGFIDKNPESETDTVRGKKEKVLAEDYFLKNVQPSKNIHLFMGVGDAKLLTELADRFQEYSFPNLIAKDFVCDKISFSMGRGNIFTSGCIFTVDIKIGSFNVFNLTTTVGHDTEIGSCNILNPGTNISGSVKIGSGNLFGTGSTVLQEITIGDHNILGASSLANKSFSNNNIMVGVPAKDISKK